MKFFLGEGNIWDTHGVVGPHTLPAAAHISGNRLVTDKQTNRWTTPLHKVPTFANKKDRDKWIYIAFISAVHSKCSGMDHTAVPVNLHHAWLYLVSIHQMALPLTHDGIRLIAA